MIIFGFYRSDVIKIYLLISDNSTIGLVEGRKRLSETRNPGLPTLPNYVSSLPQGKIQLELHF